MVLLLYLLLEAKLYTLAGLNEGPFLIDAGPYTMSLLMGYVFNIARGLVNLESIIYDIASLSGRAWIIIYLVRFQLKLT